MEPSGHAFGVPKDKLRAIQEAAEKNPGFRKGSIQATLATMSES
jgi:hypothetical protein